MASTGSAFDFLDRLDLSAPGVEGVPSKFARKFQ